AGATGSAAASLAPVTFFVFGLGLPYFAAAWSLGWVMRAMERIKAYLRFVPLAAGGLSVFLGVLMLVSDKF
ncbi:MAG: cytochrome c biogenesis protein CcdA, partial [Chloroflexi bacterium]|nr:cytochrome c biogenesis protein CcdA [Chloroflexota bacterium]